MLTTASAVTAAALGRFTASTTPRRSVHKNVVSRSHVDANGLVLPHGGSLKCSLLEGQARADALKRAQGMKRINIASRENGDLIMMGIGGFSPLNKFMGRADWKSVCEKFLLADGTFWPIPITMSVDKDVAKATKRGEEIALFFKPRNEIVGTIKVDDVWEMTKKERDFECQNVFTTCDPEHPGVKMVMEQKAFNMGGNIVTLSEGEYPEKYKGIYMRPAEVRQKFAARKWKTIAALQLRNPMHRSHEYLAKIAAEVCDGVFIHSLVGNLKPGDIPAEVRVKCIDALVSKYFVPANVMQGGYPLDMRYGGPREALLHALFRQNYGCSHMIIGRDHAGVGNYYGPFDAHYIFDKIPTPADPNKALQCQPMRIDWTFYCVKCDGMASLRTCPHDKKDRVIVSGTMVRKLLSEKGELPDHFGRTEVIEILRKYYENLTEKVEVKLHKAATM
ncbi:sulfate adenylyltransferase [Pelomyxa schiedti]|nr:ATP sulfurylase, mitochondrial [Pelomyxa schiedti]KAH3746222.1 sulfate adenylyltransferase [Pelomyxa schiedti]